jgi:collagen type III alpha
MPTTLEPPPVLSIDKQLTQAAGRIRTTDVLTGLLAVVVFTLGYATAMIVLDRYFGMPGWVRQIGFLGWLGILGYATYRYMIVPFGRHMNPLYVAKQVETAIPDAKNVVVNYVDLKGTKLPESVQRAVAGRAAAEVTDADVHKAGESKRLVGLGIAAAVLAVLLAGLFLLFSPAQFNSLLSRTFHPFASTAIASKTRITVTFPNDPNLSVTSGTPVVLQVNVDGRLPSVDGDDRVRLLFRHNPEDAAYEAVPFEAGGTNREFQLKIPESVVQNGIWYKVAGGDGETAEYRVTVRPRPLVLGFAVTYEYPEYLRMPKETVDRPQIEAYRGTKVTITAKTNRAVQSGRIAFDGKPQAESGTVPPDETSAIRYAFTVTESGAYRLFFTTTDGDVTIDPPVYPIKVIPDNAPAVTIVQPEPDEITLPLNGRLAIDAVATDDLGLAKLAIQARLVGPVPTPLTEKIYALKLKRDEDGSHPTRVEMKDSVGLAELKAESGVPVTLKEGDTIEYWVEATDNCGYEKANVGRSAVKRVKLVAPVTQPEPKKEMEQKANQRKQEEKAQGEKQQEKFEKEQRPPPPGQAEKQPPAGEQPPQDQKPDPQSGEKGTQSQDPKQGEKGTQPQDPMAPEKGSPPQDSKGGEKSSPEGGEKGTPPQDSKGGEKGAPQDAKSGDKQNPTGNEKGTPPQGSKGGEKATPSQDAKSGEASQGGEAKPSPAEEQKNQEIKNQADRVAKEIQSQNPKSGQDDSQQQGQPSKEQVEEFKQAAKDAQSSDPATKKKGEDKLDQMIGKEARQQAQKDAEQLKKDLASKNDNTREAAEQKVKDMAERMGKEQSGSGQQGGGGQEKQPTKEQIEQFQNAAKDLNNPDPAKRAAAEKAVDDAIGKDAREQAQKEAEQLKKDLASKDDKTREAAEKKVQDMADKMAKREGGSQPKAGDKAANQDKKSETGNAQAGGQQPTKEQIDEMKNAAKDLTSDNPAKKKAAQEKLDNMIGEQNRKDAEKLANDLKSNDPKTREAAEQKVKDMADKMAKGQGGKPDAEEKSAGGKPPTKEQIEEMKNAAKDLASDDPAKQQAAREKLDKMVGEENRKGAEKLANDLKSDDPKTREAAEQKVKDMADKMAKEQQSAGGKPDDAKAVAAKQEEIKDAMKKLGSDDPTEKKAAQDTLDKSIGEDKRKAAENLQKDLKSNNPSVRKEAEKKAEQLANGNEKLPEPGQGDKPMSPEDAQKLADKAKDLTSQDESKRKDAEKELDEKVGKENREKLQKAMNDMQSGDPQKMADAQKQMDDWKKQAEAGNPGRKNDQPNPGGFGSGNPGGDPLKDNPADRLKTAELQLKTFKENRDNKALREKLGYTEEEYDRFLEGYEKLIESERKRIEVAAKVNPQAGPKSLNVNRGEKVGARGTVAGPQGASAGTAPPGYADASRKFAEEAAKKKPVGGNQE